MNNTQKDIKKLKWAVIDIETTGLDPSEHQIIDIGFLVFDGTRLLQRYSSLVQCKEKLSNFIQKLTQINPSDLEEAPAWDEILPDIQDALADTVLLAHNAEFEYSFLSPWLGTDRIYADSLNYLALLFPKSPSLKLEEFLCQWGIAEKELHRGLADAQDLLKVMLLATYWVKQQREWSRQIEYILQKQDLTSHWPFCFFNSSSDELIELAEQIDFDLMQAYTEALKRTQAAKTVVIENKAEPAPENLSFSGQAIKQLFSDENKIRQRLPFFKHRESQVELALKTGQSFKNQVHALVQAPTGTGKTLGYLLPSALFTLSQGEQILVATGTKTLQHQAMEKDVPLLRQWLGLDADKWPVKKLVGSQNHLCELLFRQKEEEAAQDLLAQAKPATQAKMVSFDEDKFVSAYFESVFLYNASRGSEEGYILREHIPYVFKRKYKAFDAKEREVATDFRSCGGSHCPLKGQCSYINGLKEAKDASLVIGNHALMYSWPKSLPRPQYIIVDEAHKLEEETTRAFAKEVSGDQLEKLSQQLRHLQGVGSLFYLLSQSEHEAGESSDLILSLREEVLKSQQMLHDHLIPLKDLMEQFFKQSSRYSDTYWNELPMVKNRVDSGFDNNPLGKRIFNHLDSVHFIIKHLITQLTPYTSRWDMKTLEEDGMKTALTRFQALMAQLEDLEVALDYAITGQEGYSHAMKYQAQEGWALHCAPINVGKVIHDQLLSSAASVVFTSATLGNIHGDQGAQGIEWATGYAYLKPEKRFKSGLYLEPTYNYKDNTRVFLCDDVPSLHSSDFVPSMMTHLIKLMKQIGGRSLLLFSARTRFEAAREILWEELDGQLPIFVQGMGLNVVEEFKKAGEGILLGMESFGEGIDVPGDALQFVFIDKIPDLRMEQVITDRRDFYQRNLGNEFVDYYLAHRTRSLHQKLGRLLRTETDRGGVIIVDSRIRQWKPKTLQQVYKLMEPYEIRREQLKEACEQVEAFILNQ